MQTADVVIVGGGMVGSSIAYHLAASGCRNLLVIERESTQDRGSSGKSMGGVRAQFSTPVSIQMALYSIPFYARFEANLGCPGDYRPARLPVLHQSGQTDGLFVGKLPPTSEDGSEGCSATGCR
jgi:sarcosine oxidase, subunit beta